MEQGAAGLRSAAREADVNREIVAQLMPTLRKWVDLYHVDPATWPDDDRDLLGAAHVALNLHEAAR